MLCIYDHRSNFLRTWRHQSTSKHSSNKLYHQGSHLRSPTVCTDEPPSTSYFGGVKYLIWLIKFLKKNLIKNLLDILLILDFDFDNQFVFKTESSLKCWNQIDLNNLWDFWNTFQSEWAHLTFVIFLAATTFASSPCLSLWGGIEQSIV